MQWRAEGGDAMHPGHPSKGGIQRVILQKLHFIEML